MCFNNYVPTTCQPTTLHPLYDKLVADSSQSDSYKKALLDSESLDTIVNFLTQDYKHDKIGIEGATTDLTDILVAAGKKVFKIRERGSVRHTSHKNTKKKPWYDHNCSSIKKELRTVKPKMIKDPYNSQLQSSYIQKTY